MEESHNESTFHQNPREILFRSSAMDRLSSMEELDELFLAVLPRRRLIWLGAAILLAAMIIVSI